MSLRKSLKQNGAREKNVAVDSSILAQLTEKGENLEVDFSNRGTSLRAAQLEETVTDAPKFKSFKILNYTSETANSTFLRILEDCLRIQKIEATLSDEVATLPLLKALSRNKEVKWITLKKNSRSKSSDRCDVSHIFSLPFTNLTRLMFNGSRGSIEKFSNFRSLVVSESLEFIDLNGVKFKHKGMLSFLRAIAFARVSKFMLDDKISTETLLHLPTASSDHLTSKKFLGAILELKDRSYFSLQKWFNGIFNRIEILFPDRRFPKPLASLLERRKPASIKISSTHANDFFDPLQNVENCWKCLNQSDYSYRGI